jgi:LPXTG-site transpeptidase (sortase) family protein
MTKRALIWSVCALAIIWTTVAISVQTPPAQALIGRSAGQGLQASIAGPSASPPSAPVAVVDVTPTRLVIPSINLDATIEARGLDANRNIETPKDFRHVAWYDLGPAPGQPGDAVVNGHVNWWTGDAVFTRLAQVRAGDEVIVIRADGARVRFKVTAIRTVPWNARVASLFAPSPVATLTLITCTGVWNPLIQSDTKRLLVSAVLD